MDITGHFESASCVIEVDGNDTLAQVKGKLLAELGVPRARHVGVRMRGGGDIGDEDVRICDTAIDEGCAVELYYRRSISPGMIPHVDGPFSLTLSPCDRYLAVVRQFGVSVYDTETHEKWCTFRLKGNICIAFSPCSEWISCNNLDTECIEVRRVKTGALEHSFACGVVRGYMRVTAWSPCGTMLLSGPRVWDIATGRVVHEWPDVGDSFKDCYGVFGVAGNKMVTFGATMRVTIRDYTTGTEVRALVGPSYPNNVALAPNQRFVAACFNDSVRVWDIETGECVFEHVSGSDAEWVAVVVSNDVVAAYAQKRRSVTLWSISTAKQLWSSPDVDCVFGLALSSCGGVLMHGRVSSIHIIDISHLT